MRRVPYGGPRSRGLAKLGRRRVILPQPARSNPIVVPAVITRVYALKRAGPSVRASSTDATNEIAASPSEPT